MSRQPDMALSVSLKALCACLVLCVVALPASAEDQLTPGSGAVMEVSTLMGDAPAAAGKAAPGPDWDGDWQDQVILPRHDVSPYVPIDMLSPYPPPRGDLVTAAASEAEVQAGASPKVSIAPRSEKTSLEASQPRAPTSPWHMFDTGEAFKILDSRGRLMAYILYQRGEARGSNFLSPEEARAFAQSVLDLQSTETVAQVSSRRAADAGQAQ